MKLFSLNMNLLLQPTTCSSYQNKVVGLMWGRWKNDDRLSILAGSLSMSLNLTEGFTFLEQTIGEESSTWIIHARPVPQDEPFNDSFFLNGRSLIPPLIIISENLELNRRRPKLDLFKINLRVNDFFAIVNATLSNTHRFIQFI